MNVLFICTSNSDRSPALEKYFRATYPKHSYRSAGINKYFTNERGTKYLKQEDIDWANAVVYAEPIHKSVTQRNYQTTEMNGRISVVLELGEYKQTDWRGIDEEYLVRAEEKLRLLLTVG